MDSLQDTTHSAMKEKRLVVAEQYKDIYTATQNWVNLVKQRRRNSPVDIQWGKVGLWITGYRGTQGSRKEGFGGG